MSTHTATATFFHVDRGGTLGRTSGVVSLNGGLSAHGSQYHRTPAALGSVTWNGSSDNVMSTSLGIENFWELFRHAQYPDLPSRFRSMFAFTSIAGARDFARDVGGGLLWQVTVPAETVTHRGDMNWLTADAYPRMFEYAQNYWSGHPSSTPRWEVLIALPVTAELTVLP